MHKNIRINWAVSVWFDNEKRKVYLQKCKFITYPNVELK
jgi:hypothetical protein